VGEIIISLSLSLSLSLSAIWRGHILKKNKHLLENISAHHVTHTARDCIGKVKKNLVEKVAQICGPKHPKQRSSGTYHSSTARTPTNPERPKKKKKKKRRKLASKNLYPLDNHCQK